MKINEVSEQANSIKLAVKNIELGTFFEFYQLVKENKIVPMTDENDNIVGFNVVKDTPSSMKVCKYINRQFLTVGDTEEDRMKDEEAMREFYEKFSECDLQEWFEKCLVIAKTGLNPDDIIYDESDDKIFLVFVSNKQVLDLYGNVVVDLSQDPDLEGASDNLVHKFLVANLNLPY